MSTQSKTKRFLGIDPGYGRLGFGVIDIERGKSTMIAHGVITTPAGTKAGERLHEIAKDLRSLIDKHEPNALVLEELFFAKSTTTALKVAEVRGVILLLAEEADIPALEVKPNEVKMALTGYGRADKRQMQEMVKVVLGLTAIPKPDDAADALAIAFTGSNKRY